MQNHKQVQQTEERNAVFAEKEEAALGERHLEKSKRSG